MSLAAASMSELALSEDLPADTSNSSSRKPPPSRVTVAKADARATPEQR